MIPTYFLQLMRDTAVSHREDCEAALPSAKGLPGKTQLEQLTNQITELDSVANECGELSHSLSGSLTTLKEWNAVNTILTQSLNNRNSSLNAINSLNSSDKFMIENRLSKCQVNPNAKTV